MKEKCLKYPHIEELIQKNELKECRERLMRLITSENDIAENPNSDHENIRKTAITGYQITINFITQLIHSVDRAKFSKKSISTRGEK